MLRIAVFASAIAGSAASYAKIAGYQPNSKVTDHNYLDMDQKALEANFGSSTDNNYDAVKAIYEQGGHSKAYTEFQSTVVNAHEEGDACVGKDAAGNTIAGKLKSDVTPGATAVIECLYPTAETYPPGTCYVGGLPAGTDTMQVTTGCITLDDDAEGNKATLVLGSGDDAETLTVGTTANLAINAVKAGRTLAGFGTSSTTTKKMFTMSSSCPGCPYKTYTAMYRYYGQHDYMDAWVLSGIDGTKLTYASSGTAKYEKVADFETYDTQATRKDAIKKGTAYMNVWMYTVREFEDAIDDCVGGSLTQNYGSVHAWDEGVAFYAGSLEGVDGSGSGKMVYNLADKRCSNFGTCSGADGITGTSNVNTALLAEFQKGRNLLMVLDCGAVRAPLDRIITLMTIPLIQGTLRYAYKVATMGTGGTNTLENGGAKEMAEGATFAFAVLPLINECDPAAAKIVYDNMNLGAIGTCDRDMVKIALESVYPCLGITCADIGALNTGGGCADADIGGWCSVCVDTVAASTAPYELIAGYLPRSKVTDHNALDRDQKALENSFGSATDNDYTTVKAIYENGGNSKVYAEITHSGKIRASGSAADTTDDVPIFTAGTKVYGTSVADGAGNTRMVTGTVKSTTVAGATKVSVTYDTGLVQSVHNGPCTGASIPSTLAVSKGGANTGGCFSPTGDFVVGWTGVKATGVVNKAGRTLKGFGTESTTTKKMYTQSTSCPGCPYKTYEAMYKYYGQHDYMDAFVAAGIAGTKLDYAATDDFNYVKTVDFATYNTQPTRKDCIKKGTAYWHVWMYTVREFEDAIDDCVGGQIDNNYGSAHAWDEGVAFYTGSLEGVDGSGSGAMIYNLADKRCSNFGTCGADGTATSGTAKVNLDLFTQFDVAQAYLYYGQCSLVRPVLNHIISMMTIPMVQGTLRYAYKVGTMGPGGTNTLDDGAAKEMAEGTTFAFGILPLIAECSATAGKTVYDNMNLGAVATVDRDAVKSALESVYACLGISCGDIGALNEAGGCATADIGGWCSVCTDPKKVEIKSSFTIPGAVSDVTQTQKDQMKAVIAGEAGVPTSDVTLSLSAGSVVVDVTISVPETIASSVESTLDTGIMKDASSLQAALVAGGLTGVTVAELTPPSTVSTVTKEEMPAGVLVILIIVAIVAVFAVFCICYLIQQEKKGKPIFIKLSGPGKA